MENPLKGIDYSILQQCIHCGMCLPSCPTYDETRKETSSPRGRIALMRAIADDNLEIGDGFVEEMFFCLGCLACESVCPANVDYARLFERGRAAALQSGAGSHRWRRFLIRWLFASRRRLRLLARLLRFYQRSGFRTVVRRLGLLRILGRRTEELEGMAPEIDTNFTRTGRFSSKGPARLRVGMLAGCVQDVAFAGVNRDTIEVLTANGCEVELPPSQQCCGSLHGHNGQLEDAASLARANLDAFDVNRLDAIIVNSAGCGSFMKQYGELLDDDPVYRDRARAWSARVKDISEFLVGIGFVHPSGAGQSVRVTYHDACHLCHGQKIRNEPREILRAVPGVELTEMAESDWCCGSAGIYNLTHPELAAKLLDRKMRNIVATQPGVVASANPGCTLQLRFGAQKDGLNFSVEHPVSLLAEAYRKDSAGIQR